MRKRTLGVLILLILLSQTSGYAWITRKNFEKVLSSWMGRDADELVPSWGAPGNVYNLSSGGKVLTYVINTGSGGSIVPIGTSYMAINRQWYCKVNFTVDSHNAITNWSYEGNNCRSNAPKETRKQTEDFYQQTTKSNVVTCAAKDAPCK